MKAVNPAEESLLVGLVGVLSKPTFWVAALLVAAASAMLASLLVTSKAKAGYRSCANGHFLAYLIWLTVGNIAATAAAMAYFKFDIPQSGVVFGYALAGAFVGVAGFEGVIKHVNVTVWGRSLLTLAKWIQTAKDGAVSATLEKDVVAKNEREARLVHALSAIPTAELNAIIASKLGAGEISKMDALAARSNSDPRIYKAARFVKANPAQAEAVLAARFR